MNNIQAKYLLIDCNNLFYRNYAIQEKQITTNNLTRLYNNTIIHTLISINKIERDLKCEGGILYFLFDNPKSKINLRSEISAEYKANRKKMPDDYYKALDVLAIILQYRNNDYKIARCPNLEADDLTKPIIENIRLYDRQSNIFVCSNDFDYARNITKNIYWYNFIELITYESFNAKEGYYPTNSSITLYKTLKGDKSDGIANIIHNIPKEILLKLITKYDTIYSLIGNIEFEDIPDKWKKMIREKQAELRTNYLLVSFVDADYNDIKDFIIDCKYSPKALKDLYNSVTDNIEEIDKRDLTSYEKKVTIDNFFMESKLERL